MKHVKQGADHPSGRPKAKSRWRRPLTPTGTSSGHWNARLNNVEGAGGMGFRPEPVNDIDLWHQTIARIARDT